MSARFFTLPNENEILSVLNGGLLKWDYDGDSNELFCRYKCFDIRIGVSPVDTTSIDDIDKKVGICVYINCHKQIYSIDADSQITYKTYIKIVTLIMEDIISWVECLDMYQTELLNRVYGE